MSFVISLSEIPKNLLKSYLFVKRKIAVHLDYLYGAGTSSYWPLDELQYEISKKTGRIKRVYWNGRLLCTIKENGSMALTLLGASLLVKCKRVKDKYGVTVSEEAVEPVSEGKSVFAKHVIYCGDGVRPKMDVPIFDPKGNLIAVGQSVLSAKAIREMKRGVAIKVREGLKKSSFNI